MSDLRAVIEGYALSYRLPWYVQAVGPKDLERGIAAHDSEVAAKAWDEGAREFEWAFELDHENPWQYMPNNPYRIEKGAHQ